MERCEDCQREFNSKEALEMHNQSKHFEKVKTNLSLTNLSLKHVCSSSKQKKKIRNYLIVFLIVLLVSIFVYQNFIPSADAPILTLSQTSVNFGDVSQSLGTASKEVTITNTGKSNLIIDNMDTSCGCTSASLVYKNQESPEFSMAMHGTNPNNFNLIIPPGEQAQLKIYYNPNVHKELRGAVIRSVYISSNDPINPKKEVRINVNQVD